MNKLLSTLLFCTGLTFGLEGAQITLRPISLREPGHEWMCQVADKELAPYVHGITKEMLDRTWNDCVNHNLNTGYNWFQRYKIVKKQVIGPKGKMKNLLLALVNSYPLPDLDFITLQQDILWRANFKHTKFPGHAPIFVSAKPRGSKGQILFVDWYYDIFSNNPDGWNGLIELFQKKGNLWPWNKKIDKVIWRGIPHDAWVHGEYHENNWTKIPRGALVSLSINYPELVDAAFVNCSLLGCDDSYLRKINHLARIADFLPVLNHTQYKYQIIIDGVTATYPGTQWRLCSGCLSFKQESPDLMWFEQELIPYVHYVPVDRYMSNLIEQVLWAKDHDDEARAIAENAKQFATTHLMPEHILLFCFHTLYKYAMLLRFSPTND